MPAWAPCQLFTSLDGWCFGSKTCQVLVHVNSVFDMCYVDHREPLDRPSYGRMKHFFPIYHRYFSDDCIPAWLHHLFFKPSKLPHCPCLKYQLWPGSLDCPYYQPLDTWYRTTLIITCTILLIADLWLSSTKTH